MFPFVDKTELVKAGRGKLPVDVLFKNARVVNVFSGEIEKKDVAVYKGFVVGFGTYRAKKTVDLKNRLLIPGLVDEKGVVVNSLDVKITKSNWFYPLELLNDVIDEAVEKIVNSVN